MTGAAMPRTLHIGNSRYGSLAGAGHTLRIWKELAAGAEEYHVLARSDSLRPKVDRDGNLTLHLLPGLPSQAFPLLAYHGALLAKRHRVEVIVCQDPVLGGVAAVQIGRALGIPTMLEIHTDVHFHHMQSASVLGRLALYALRGATRVRLVSRLFEAPLLAAGVPAGSLVYIPYRVDDRLFSASPEKRRRGRGRLGAAEDELIVLSIGRFVAQKGYTELIRTFGEIRRRRPGSRLVLVGGGPLEGEYRRAAADQGGSVTLIDWLDQAALVDLMAAADIYVQPSLSNLGEAMPRTVLEAMACRLPVVASRVGGIPEVVHDGIGRLVEPGEPAALAGAILQLAADPELRDRLGSAGAVEASTTYGWRAGFDRYRACISELARGAR